jgi:hypothetical protein
MKYWSTITRIILLLDYAKAVWYIPLNKLTPGKTTGSGSGPGGREQHPGEVLHDGLG